MPSSHAHVQTDYYRVTLAASVMDTNFQPVILKNTSGHYRQHPLEFKRALVALSLKPGASVAHIAHEHGVNADLVFSWLRLYEQGRFDVPALMRDDGLLPVLLAPSAPAPNNADTDGGVDGATVLELGEVRVQIEGQPNSSVELVPITPAPAAWRTSASRPVVLCNPTLSGPREFVNPIQVRLKRRRVVLSVLLAIDRRSRQSRRPVSAGGWTIP